MNYFALLIFAIVIFGCNAQELGSTISFRGDWENGITGVGNWAGKECARPNASCQLITEPVRQGKYAARFEVTENDYIGVGERAEVNSIINATGAIDHAENIPGKLHNNLLDLGC